MLGASAGLGLRFAYVASAKKPPAAATGISVVASTGLSRFHACWSTAPDCCTSSSRRPAPDRRIVTRAAALAGPARPPRLRGGLVRVLRLAALAAPGPRADRVRERQPDLRLVVCLVAACDRQLDESARLARALRTGRRQPGLDTDRSRAGARLLAADRGGRARRRLQRRGAAHARPRRVDGVPPLPLPHRLAVGLARRRVPVRVLACDPAAAALRAPPGDGGLSGAAGRARRRPVCARRSGRSRPCLAARRRARRSALALDRVRA